MSNTIRILLADDHPLFREGVAHSLSVEPDFEVIAQASSGEEAVEMVHEHASRHRVAGCLDDRHGRHRGGRKDFRQRTDRAHHDADRFRKPGKPDGCAQGRGARVCIERRVRKRVACHHAARRRRRSLCHPCPGGRHADRVFQPASHRFIFGTHAARNHHPAISSARDSPTRKSASARSWRKRPSSIT